MNDEGNFTFCFPPRQAENYFTSSHDMQAMLRGRGDWKFDRPRSGSRMSEQVDADTEAAALKRDIALTYILTSVNKSAKQS